MDFPRFLPRRKNICGIWFVLDAFCAYVPEIRTDKPHKIRIRIPPDCLPLLAPIRRESQEILMVLTLDGVHQVIKSHKITVGLANQNQVHPRETYVCALEDRAVAIVIAHNHPSGSLEPSIEDLLTTRRLADAGRILGIPLLDHMIIGGDGYTSLRERFPDYFEPAKR